MHTPKVRWCAEQKWGMGELLLKEYCFWQNSKNGMGRLQVLDRIKNRRKRRWENCSLLFKLKEQVIYQLFFWESKLEIRRMRLFSMFSVFSNTLFIGYLSKISYLRFLLSKPQPGSGPTRIQIYIWHLNWLS